MRLPISVGPSNLGPISHCFCMK